LVVPVNCTQIGKFFFCTVTVSTLRGGGALGADAFFSSPQPISNRTDAQRRSRGVRFGNINVIKKTFPISWIID
jgi:hypothetical protein